MIVNIKKISALCICMLSAFTAFADTEWGKGAGKLSDWQFASYKDVKSSATEFSGKTICVLGVKSPFLFSPNFDWDASPNDVLAIEIKSSRAGSGHLHFKHSSKDGYVDELRERLPTPGGDGKWHLMLVPLKNSDWKGKISNIRLGMLYEDGVDIAIRRIKLFRKQEIVGNLLKNGDFEMPTLDAMPNVWSVVGDGVSASTAANDGGSALQFSGKGTATLSQPPAYIDFLESATAALSLSLKAQATAAGTLTATVLMQDALRNDIATKRQAWDITPQQSPAVMKIPEWEIPLETARAVLSLEWKTAEEATLSLDDVCLLQRQAPKPETWTGEWIRPGDKPDDPPRDMFFRKSFDIPQGAKNVWLLCNCDDYINDVFVNGAKLPPMPNMKVFNAADSIRIDDFVKPGRNVVAVHGYNFNILGGVICDIAFKTPNGWSRIGSDASWLSSSDKQAEWMKPQFDDSKWFRPITMGKGAGTPFGVLDAPTVLDEEDIAVRSFKATAKSVSPSAVSIDYSIELERLAESNNATSLALILKNNPNYPEKLLPPTGFRLATIPVKPGETLVEGAIAYPDFLPSCRFILRVESATGFFKPAETAITVPGFLNPPRPAKLSFTAEYAPYLMWGDTPLEIIHHWCGNDGQITEERLGNARDIQIPFYIGNHYSHWGWRPNGKYDFSPIDNYIYRILEFDPNARCSMQIAVDNYHNKELQAWLDAHPTECAMREDGTTVLRQIHSGKNIRVVSHASRLWREEMRRSLTALSSHLRKMPFGNRAISIQPTSGLGGEWCMWGTFDTGGGVERLDYSRPFRQYFADFAIKKYGSIEKMNAAWGTEFFTPEDIRLPSSQERDRNDWFEFLDAKKSRRIIDYRQSISELIADDVIAMCEAVKTGSDNQMYAGTFYGYTTYVASGLPGRSEGGHFALGKVLNSPHVDYLTHLLRYADRKAGGPAGFMTPESSLHLHGKVPFVQADIRTHRLPPEAPDAIYGRLNNLQEGIAVIQRDFSNAVMNGVGYEFGYYGNGWIAADKRMMQTVKRCREIERLAREKGTKRIDTENSIAVIVDDISTYYSAQSSNIHQFSLLYQIPEFYHTGVGLDTYLLEDLPLMPKYKCYVFLNTFHLTPAQEDFIQKNLKRDGNVLAFIYAQGVATDDGINPSKVQEITGIKMDVLDKAVKTQIKYIENSIPAGKYLPVGNTFGLKTTHGPVFVPREGTVLANMTDGGTPALVVKGFGDHTVCYTSILQISSEILKGLAELAGITVINQNSQDCTYVSDNMFAVHTGNGGNRTFHVPPKFTKKATELFTGREFPITDGKFEYSMEPISTSLFLME